MPLRHFPLCLLVLLLACNGQLPDGQAADTSTLTSPDGTLAAHFFLNDKGELYYEFERTDSTLIAPSRLGFTEATLGEITKDLELTGTDIAEGRETYRLPWGEVENIDEAYAGMTLQLRHARTDFRFRVEARLFDEGLGLRYVYPAQGELDTLRILEEHTTFRLAGDPLVNWGPGDWNSYENLTELTRLSEVDATKYDARGELISRVVPNNALMTPATLRLADGTHLSFHEAALIDYPEMTLGVTDDGLESILAGHGTRKAKAVRALPFESPWRTVAVEARAVDLLTNLLYLHLNPPNELGDISWFEPQTYAGVWWEMHLGVGTWDYAGGQSTNTMVAGLGRGSNRHAANTQNVRRYIDFCAENNIGGLLVEGWNTGWEVWLDPDKRKDVFDFVTPYPDYDLKEVVAYGKSKGVDIIMHHETSASVPQYEKQQDAAYSLMQELGIHAVKTGYVGNILPEGEYHHGQYMVRHFRNTYRKAAEYQIAVNPHEPVKQTGERRTLPNAISAEAARGGEYASNGKRDGVNPPHHLAHMVYTRALAGPFDYTPGLFRLNLDDYREPGSRIGTTLGQQLGAYIVVMAPVQMLADLPEHYRQPDGSYHPAMPFLRGLACNWEQTYPLAGALGDYAIVARQERDADRYYIGGIAGAEPRTNTVSLGFLPAGRNYTLTLYRDGDGVHYWDNPTDLQIETRTVTRADSLTVTMQTAGGFAGVLE